MKRRALPKARPASKNKPNPPSAAYSTNHSPHKMTRTTIESANKLPPQNLVRGTLAKEDASPGRVEGASRRSSPGWPAPGVRVGVCVFVLWCKFPFGCGGLGSSTRPGGPRREVR